MDWFKCFIFLIFSTLSTLQAMILKTEGCGFLEEVDGQLILHVKGDDFQRGFQHGKLLADLIQTNVHQFVDTVNPAAEERKLAFFAKLNTIMPFIPTGIIDEIMGLSEGSQIPFQKLLVLNLFPEMFHCSAIALKGHHTAHGKLYHVRALDYRIGKGLQKTSVLIVSHPQNRISNFSVSYAGFIGCITGMNQEKISLGEVGGQGYGNWNGMPMAFIMKQALENASTLNEAKKYFEQNRTCEYFYLVSDGKSESSLGLYATASQLQPIEMGTPYCLLSPIEIPTCYGKDGQNDKFFFSPYELKQSKYQTLFLGKNNKLFGLFLEQPSESIIITGYAHPHRYPHLAEAIGHHDKVFEIEDIQKLLNPLTTLSSNLHNAIFLPSELKVWISHAGASDEPAYSQPYHFYDVGKLFQHQLSPEISTNKK